MLYTEAGMDLGEIVRQLDREIARLEQVRNLLREDEGPQRRGRPAVSSKATSFNAAKFEERPKKRRTMSAAGRARIVAAQKKRWARQHREEKRAAGAPAKKTAASKQAKRPAPARKATAQKE
jgi:hypothetical protein